MSDDADAWAAEQRADAAIAGKSRSRWLARQAAEEATFAGVLVDLSERGEEVVVRTGAGRSHRGRLTLVSEALVVIETASARVAVPFDRMGAVRREGDFTEGPTGDRHPIGGPALGTWLAALVGDRPIVALSLDSEPLRGELLAVGVDVVTLRLGARATTVHVRLQSVSEVLLATSG
jgi:hypothetical protein